MMIKLEWNEAMQHTAMIYDLMKDKEANVKSIEVVRMDGSTVRIVYYPKSDCFMARRYRADGRLGASMQFNGSMDGLMNAFRYRLPARFHEN